MPELSLRSVWGTEKCCGTCIISLGCSVMAALEAWRSWFWDADFWLPENCTWQGLEEAKKLKWAQVGELYLCFPVAIVLIVLRVLFER